MRFAKGIIVFCMLMSLSSVFGSGIPEAAAGNGNPEVLSDALRFKEEYESLNGMPRSDTSFALYNTTYIPEKNAVRYIDAQKAFELLGSPSSSSVIYFGANWCPWCRNIIPVLLEEVDRNSVPALYYVDVTDERDKYVLADGAAVRESEGTEGYSRLLEALDEYLKPYILTSDSGESVDTGEKRMYIPFLLVVDKGKVLHAVLCEYALEENQTKFDPLSEAQADMLHSWFSGMLAALH